MQHEEIRMRTILFFITVLVSLSAVSEREYINGGYWTVTSVDTKEGKFDAYVSDLNKYWRKSMEAGIKEGKILGYQVFSNVHARDGEPNLWLAVHWKSGADILDTPDEYFDAQTEKLFGSYDDGTEALVKRGDLRTIMSTVLMREVTFE
jgi:hypothetical protein